MDHDKASYSKLLEKESGNSFHDSDTSSLQDDVGFQHERYPPSPRTNWTRRLLMILACLLVMTYIFGSLAFMLIIYRNGEYHIRAPDPPYSPLSDIVRYKTVKSGAGYDEDLAGYPSPAHDKAWLKLVGPALSRISYEEMKLGREDPEHSIEVGDGKGGYMGSLGVYHELHCLRRLKLYLHKEHYYPGVAHGSEDDKYELGHLHHCLESIRLSLMCGGDTAIYSFKWPDRSERVQKPKTKTNSERTCVDWDVIESWAQNRSIGMNPRLKRPAAPHDHEHMKHDKEHHG
jgi:hypothetical protein